MGEDETEAGTENLVRRAQAGDRDAAGELLLRYGERVRAAIRQRLAPRFRRRFDTEDVFQSAVAVSLGDLENFRYQGERAFVAWLTTVAERRLLGDVRKHRAQRRDVRREAVLEDAGALSGGLTSPVDGAERSELHADLEDAIARLDADEQRVIRLRSYESLTFREIAESMGLADRSAARNLFQRALRRMGEFVERQRPPQELRE